MIGFIFGLVIKSRYEKLSNLASTYFILIIACYKNCCLKKIYCPPFSKSLNLKAGADSCPNANG